MRRPLVIEQRSMILGVASTVSMISLIHGSPLALTLTEGSPWTSFPIAVCFEDPKPEYKQDRAQIRKSVEQSWSKESAVTFEGWGECREDDVGIRIRLSDQHPKTRARGRGLNGLEGGIELPKLWGLASLSINAKSSVHEFGHALGFGHEYARADAPYKDVCGATDRDGKRYIEDDIPISAFDFDTIMVACIEGATEAFSIGLPKLSAGDIYGLVETYGSAPDNILDEDEPGDRFGHSLAVGDFDGDGMPDLAVGAPGETLEGSVESHGAVYLYKGDPKSGLRPWVRLVQETAQSFGNTLGSERLDQDRRDELIIGDENGELWVFKGRSRKPPKLWEDAPALPATKLLPSETGENLVTEIEPFDIEASADDIGFGQASILADLDVDGHEDLIVTAPSAMINGVPSGQVFIYRSPNTEHPWKEQPRTFTPWYRFGQAY